MNAKMGRECYVCKSLFPSFVVTYDGKAGEILRFYSEEMSMLVFILSGRISISVPYIDDGKSVEKRGFFLSPMGEETMINILSNETKLLTYKFNSDGLYCIRHFLNQLNDPKNKFSTHNLYVLYLNDPIYEYLMSLQQILLPLL